jgi:hypothetical protein
MSAPGMNRLAISLIKLEKETPKNWRHITDSFENAAIHIHTKQVVAE